MTARHLTTSFPGSLFFPPSERERETLGEAGHLGSARTDQNFTSVNEHATMDGIVYFFSSEFKKVSDTVLGPLRYIFFVVKMYHGTADTTFFLKVSEKEWL